jgi:hypothetical protein
MRIIIASLYILIYLPSFSQGSNDCNCQNYFRNLDSTTIFQKVPGKVNFVIELDVPSDRKSVKFIFTHLDSNTCAGILKNYYRKRLDEYKSAIRDENLILVFKKIKKIVFFENILNHRFISEDSLKSENFFMPNHVVAQVFDLDFTFVGSFTVYPAHLVKRPQIEKTKIENGKYFENVFESELPITFDEFKDGSIEKILRSTKRILLQFYISTDTKWKERNDPKANFFIRNWVPRNKSEN